MKKITCVVVLVVVCSLTALADGDMGAGTRTCTNNCLVAPESRVEITKDTEATKSLAEATNDYFSKIANYFIEIAF
jgi:hypothetical protein